MPDPASCPRGAAPEAMAQTLGAGDQDEPFAKRLDYVFRRTGGDLTALELLRQILAYRSRVQP